MFYKIIPHGDTKGAIYLSKEVLLKHGFISNDRITLSAGKRQREVELILEKKLMGDEMGVSQDILDYLLIPTDLKYQLVFNKGAVKIGPVVGLLMVRNEMGFTTGKLKDLSQYCLIYPQISGLVLALSAEDINYENNSVKGYYYNPEPDKRGMQWREGTFPLPDSIFQRTSLTEEQRMRLRERTNNCLFNCNYFNKWEFWNVISAFEKASGYLPYTRLYSSAKDVEFMLSRYESAYLKPLNGTLSRGLYKVGKKDGQYVVQGNQGEVVLQTSSSDQLESFLGKTIKSSSYLIQQSISPIRVDGRHLDFRVIMQKDHTLTWKCTGIVVFVGSQGHICTNWGFTTSFENILTTYFNFSQREIYKKKQEITAACEDICRILDLTGENYGDLGFDVIIDEKLKVWILESNKRHYHTVPLWINDVQTFYEVKANPVRYAVALGGFEVY